MNPTLRSHRIPKKGRGQSSRPPTYLRLAVNRVTGTGCHLDKRVVERTDTDSRRTPVESRTRPFGVCRMDGRTDKHLSETKNPRRVVKRTDTDGQHANVESATIRRMSHGQAYRNTGPPRAVQPKKTSGPTLAIGSQTDSYSITQRLSHESAHRQGRTRRDRNECKR